MMPPLLAVEVDNNQIFAGVVAALGILLGLYMKIRSWEKSLRGEPDKREIGPQPFEVSLKDKALTHRDHEILCGPLHHRVVVLESDVRAIRHTMQKDKQEIIASGEERVSQIHRRIDELKNDINAAPARTVALLKDTKGLL